MRKFRSARLLAVASTVVLLAACGDRPTAPLSPAGTFVGRTASVVFAKLDSVTPHTANVAAGGTQLFTAWNTNNAAMDPATVTWSVSGGGTIAATGLFTAGSVAGTFTISVFDPNGPVTVTASVTVTVASGTCKSDDDKKGGDNKDCDKEKNHDDKGDKGDKGGDKDHQGKDKGGRGG
jgi:hypothetical protein